MRLRFLSLVAAGLLSVASLHAQTSSIAPRIVQSVDDSNLVTLKGNVTALAQPQFDRGEADPAMQMTSVRMVLSRSPEQDAALEQLMAEQLDKSSPNYHHWLTPEEFGKLYGAADSDIAAVVGWLQSRGFKVDPVPPGRNNIAFSGSVSQIEQAFHTQIHQFNADGEQFYSNISDPQIPAALVPVVSGVAGLNTLHPRSHVVPGPLGKYDPESKRLVPINPAERLARPDLTASNGSLYVVASDAATIYDTPNSLNANFSGSTSYTGSGVSIGIGGDAMIQTATVQNYRSKFIGDTTVPAITNVIPTATYSATNGALGEAYLDLEVSGAMAPAANIHFYVSTNLENAIQQAINDNTVDIFSLSFGECELLLTTSDNQLLNGYWQQFAAQGVAVTVSSGDSGSAGCEDHNTAQTATQGLQVSGFASTPYNIAVGGTDFYGLLSGFSTYVSSTNGTLYRSAKSYIPESTWNSSVQSDGALSANVAYVSSSTGKTNVLAGSGGPSSCSANTTTYNGNTAIPGTCTSGYTKPTWQRGTGVPSDGVRDIPDVSLLAGVSDGAAWLVCADDTSTVNGATVTANCSGTQFYFEGSGGTSASAPAFAGILALVQQKMGGGGAANRLGAGGAKTLYDLFNGTHASAIFHDITQGNISVPCTAGSPGCKQNTAGNYFMTGYDTTVGYDLATGLGSVDATQLINYWGASTGSATPTVTVQPSATSITASQSLTVNVTVTGSSGTPTGTVTLTSGTYTSSAATLSAGAASINLPAGSLAVGTDTLTVTYSGDTNYATKTGTASVTVTALPKPTVTVSPAPTSITTVQGLTVSVTVAGTTGTPTGTVTLTSGTYTSSATTLSAGAASISVPAGSLAAGTDTLTVSYSGDTTYATATGTAQVTVTALTPTVTITPGTTAINSAQSLSVALTVTGSSGTPTGTIMLSSGTYSSAKTNLSAGAATITIPANSLAAGTTAITAAYSGDGTYAATQSSVNVTVTQSIYSVTPGTPPTAITAGGTATTTVTITTSTSYSGTISLACAPAANNPSNQSGDAPTCTVNPTSVTLGGTNGNSASATVSISTTAKTAQMQKPPVGSWMAGGGTALALLVFFGIPARRRRWRTLVGMVALLIAFGGFSACGGGGGGSGSGSSSTKDPGTASGSYTFTVTGTGNPAITPAPTATISLTIN